MHRFWTIVELVEMVVANLEKPDAWSLSSAGKIVHDIAITRQFTEEGWTRFLFYSSKMRSLSLLYHPRERNSAFSVRTPTHTYYTYFEAIVSYAGHQQADVFPRLRRLSCDITSQSSLDMLKGLLTEKLESLDVSLPNVLHDQWYGVPKEVEQARLLASVTQLAVKSPWLTQLEIRGLPRYTDEHLVLLRAYAAATPRLKVLKMQPNWLDVMLHPITLEVASSWPRLEELSLLITENYENHGDVLTSSPSFTFPGLQSLELLSLGKTPVLMALRACSTPLRKLHLNVGLDSAFHCDFDSGYPRLPHFHPKAIDFTSLYEMIDEVLSAVCSSQATPQLEDLSLRFSLPRARNQITRTGEGISFEMFKPLLQQCPNMKRFELNLHLGPWAESRLFDFQDSDLVGIGEAWPGLQQFSLKWEASQLLGHQQF
ncbi:hypothetical protein CALCODRAFT_518875 [Calocera cornea HHB12733]|uniref:F-box domain-containing protein n=1 Tax=Calocera cornea HHB12733 TaxID=1353952 RepID=A0A165EPI9_9BASI|nr:hypothetical protein CALCODRAFT_518875 [Calocera cornea HHB12733]